MPRPCPVCNSPHREVYDKWVEEMGETKKGFRDIAKDAELQFGEKLLFTSFWKHKKHMESFIAKAISGEEKVRLGKAKVFKDTFDAASRLQSNIEILERLLKEKLNKGHLNVKEISSIKNLLSEIRLTSVNLDSLQERYLKSETSEEQITSFIDAIDAKDPLLASKLLEIYIGVEKDEERVEEKSTVREAESESIQT